MGTRYSSRTRGVTLPVTHDTDVSRFVVGVDSGTWRVARRQGIEMRSTLTPPGVLDRNDGGTQTVREMSEQMSQVRAT